MSREPAAVCRRRVARMVRSMMHEPFYTSGTCSAEELGVYAGWVAHPVSFAATAAIEEEADGTAVAFAGESFHESGETVLALYRRLGIDCIATLNGAFSGVIVDRRRARALLFNDRYAAERLYLHQAPEGTYFATEAKALLSVVTSLRALDDEGVAEFLTFGCTLGPRSLFQGITMLPGGSLWSFEQGSCHRTRYFEPVQWERQEILPTREFDRRFRERFTATVPRYARGTGRIGVSLTGGLDTRMIMACLPPASPPKICYTFCGLEGETLDARIAARVAAARGLDHHLVRIGRDFVTNFERYVDRTIYLTDGCAGVLGAHEVYLNAAARTLAPIRLTGNFGSEILRNMSTFKPLGLVGDTIASDFRRHMQAAAARSIRPSPGVAFAAFEEVPLNLFGTMAAAKSQLVFRTPYLDNEIVSLAFQAPVTVRQSADAALRFIQASDPRLAKIPTDRGVVMGGRGLVYKFNRLLTELAFKADYMHKEALPRPLLPLDRALGVIGQAGLLGRHKYLPYRVWFRNELAPYVLNAVTDRSTAHLPYFDQARLVSIAHDHINGRGNYLRELNAALTLAGVQRMLHTLAHDSEGAYPNIAPIDLAAGVPG